MPAKKKPELQKRTTLRLSLALYEQLEKRRKYNGNTLNGEIVASLQRVVDEDRFDQLLREIAEVKALIIDTSKK